MGSTLRPALANLFMGFHVNKKNKTKQNIVKNQFHFCDVLLCRRFVDNIICLFNLEQHADEFIKFLNSQHPNIVFTCEKQKDDKLAFLDVLLIKTFVLAFTEK